MNIKVEDNVDFQVLKVFNFNNFSIVLEKCGSQLFTKTTNKSNNFQNKNVDIFSDKAFKGEVVNPTFHILNRGLLEVHSLIEGYLKYIH